MKKSIFLIATTFIFQSFAIQSNAGEFIHVHNVAKNPKEVPAPITRTTPTTVTVKLEAIEVIAEIAPGKKAWVWTFNGTVPGPGHFAIN